MFFYKVLGFADWAMPRLLLLVFALNIAILVKTTLFPHRDPQVQAIAEICNVSYSEAESFASDGWFLFQKQYPVATKQHPVAAESQFLNQMLGAAQAARESGAPCQEAFPPLYRLDRH